MAYMAIRTKFLGPTNHRGARIKATAMDTFIAERPVSVTIPYDYGVNAETLHRNAAEKLLPRVVNDPEEISLIPGGCDRGYVFVPIHRSVLTTLAHLPWRTVSDVTTSALPQPPWAGRWSR